MKHLHVASDKHRLGRQRHQGDRLLTDLVEDGLLTGQHGAAHGVNDVVVALGIDDAASPLVGLAAVETAGGLALEDVDPPWHNKTPCRLSGRAFLSWLPE